ncbi:MAG: response regulator [bacterium]|nr:response regulator [bacterium]
MTHRKRILIVDDETELSDMVQLRLLADGYDVFIAKDGFEAMDKAEAYHPDLILLDLMMPDMNGHQVCQALRSNPETSDISIIMLTAKNQRYDKIKAKERGVRDYIVKPFEMDDLERRIENCL